MATAATKQGFRFYKSGPSGSTSAPGSRAPSRSGSPHPADGGPSASAAISTLHEASAALSSTTGPSAPAGVDPKVYHIVRRITSSTPSLLVGNGGGNKASQQSRRNSVAAVTSLVLERHREYRRKDPNWVRSSVEGAVLSLGSAAANGGGQGGGGGSPGKRRAAASIIPVGGGSDPQPRDGVDPPAKRKRLSEPNFQPADNSGELPERQLERSGSSGMLNAGLRSRYRDVAAREAREASDYASAASDANSANEADRDEEEMGDGGKAARDGSAAEGRAEQAASKPPAAAATPGATPKKKKRTKKTPSSRSSSASASGYPPDPLSSAPASIQPTSRPVERYADLGGMSGLLAQVRELVEYPLSRPELFVHLGVEPPRGVLLRGPPGCGKTHLAKAIAGELNVCYFQVSAPELVGGVSGESEQRVRTLFETASDSAPAIVFIDEIDAIAPKRGEGGGGGGGKSMEKRIVAQLLTSMDSIHPRNTRNGSAVMVLGATNRPDAMDPALRRAGRFDREIVLGAPDEGAREAILRVMTREMRTDGRDMDYKVLARKTPGFVGADLRSLTKEAAVTAINRIFRGDLLGLRTGGGGDKGDEGKEGPKEGSAAAAGSERDEGGSSAEEATPADAKEGAPSDAAAPGADDDGPRSNDIRSIVPLTPAQLDPLYVTMSDFLAAVPSVQPSSKREGFATVPDVSWDDIGALSSIREELTLSVLEPISHPERFEALGLPLPAGVLLYGPPGCGKTLLAKAIANESGANFISVKGPELLDKYVGESERSVRVVFERARTSSPCIIFFDELDSLCPRRGSDGSAGGGGVSERVVNQLLTEMDGLDSRRSVFVIAATNRPELIDPAMLRPGRLDKLLYVPLPGPGDRESILRALVARGVRLSPDVDLAGVARDPRAAGFSGADCAALLREAGLAVLRDGVLDRRDGRGGGGGGGEERPGGMVIAPHHFRYAFDHVLPSVSRRDQARYDRLRDRMARARTRGSGGAADEGEGDGSPSEQNDSSGAPEESKST